MLYYTLLGILIFTTLFELVYYWVYLDAVNRRIHRSRKVQSPKERDLPMVSVIICARNEGQNLRSFLQMVLSQDYPNYEVIVVDDESEDDTRLVIEQYQRRYSHLRSTYVPHNARIRSSKKLAITLAAKAAKGDYLLLTDADCVPNGRQWVREMVAGFTPGTEVVLGFGAYIKERTLLNRLIQYDTLFNGLQYMGMAIMGHPYMGVGRNLAYSKDLFFRENGFAGLLGFRAGDDDLFVNKVAQKRNTQVVVSKESITWSLPKQTFREWLQQKRRHLSVSPNYKSRTKWLLVSEPMVRGLFYGLLLLLCFLPCSWLWLAGGICFLLRLLSQVCVIDRSAHHFSLPCFSIGFVLFDIYLPLNNLLLMLLNTFNRKQIRQW